eukprot:m.75056 g.75056  ORF g.75056 m.75056 type:complete len:510 (+) comp8469_c0_seq2:145-1674(+)
MPIFDKEKEIIGVAQLINKQHGSFSHNDESLFEAFAVFCGLGIQAVKLHEETQRFANRAKVTMEVLSFHSQASESDVKRFFGRPEGEITTDIASISNFSFDAVSIAIPETTRCVMQMFHQIGAVEEFRIPQQVLCRWVLSIQKNYRPVTYHNWRHAFSVTHSMFSMIEKEPIKSNLSKLQRFSLLIACLSHDLDHRGTNNAFQKNTNHALSQLYSTSIMEHHHLDQCLMILNTEGNNIASNLSLKQYERLVQYIEIHILATDLATYLQRRNDYFELVATGTFAWDNDDHLKMFLSMLMTAADISAITRPWELQHRVAEVVYAEFYEQGDKEREIGVEPAPLLDRTKVDNLPQLQLGFIDFICKPVYENLYKHIAALRPLFDQMMGNRDKWEALKGKYHGFCSAATSLISIVEKHKETCDLNEKDELLEMTMNHEKAKKEEDGEKKGSDHHEFVSKIIMSNQEEDSKRRKLEQERKALQISKKLGSYKNKSSKSNKNNNNALSSAICIIV